MKNLVIIASDDDPVMSESITEIHNLSRKYDVKVLGYPEMRTILNLDPRYYFDLGIMLYTPYGLTFQQMTYIKFNARFREKFNTQPPEISFAWKGYDIAYYFLSGLAIHKKLFIDYRRSIIPICSKRNLTSGENPRPTVLRTKNCSL